MPTVERAFLITGRGLPSTDDRLWPIPKWLARTLEWIYWSMPVGGQAWGAPIVEGCYFWLWFGSRKMHEEWKRNVRCPGARYHIGWTPLRWVVSWGAHNADFTDELWLSEHFPKYWRVMACGE